MATVASTSALQGLERGIVTAANVVDHVTPHKGDWNAFVTGELQSLCEPCHKSAKREIELRGYRTDIGLAVAEPWQCCEETTSTGYWKLVAVAALLWQQRPATRPSP